MANIRDTIKPQFQIKERQPSFGRSDVSPFNQVTDSLYIKSPEYSGYNNETKEIYARLVPSDMFEKIAYNAEKHPKNLFNLTKSAITGVGSDYSLGIDSNTKLGTIAIALLAYTAAANPSQAVPELAGPVWWLSGMFASNKLINIMVKAKFNVDLEMEYVDSYGRRKKLFEDPGFICWDIVPKEEIDRIGDQLGIPRNIEERREAIHDKIQQIVVQAKTWLMLSAGITTPTVASLMADSLDKPVSLTRNMMHSAMVETLEHDVSSAIAKGQTAKAKNILQKAYLKTFGETGYIVREWGVFTQQMMEKTGLKKQIIAEMAKLLEMSESQIEKQIIPAITNKTPSLEYRAFTNLSNEKLATALETSITRALENLHSKPAEFVHQMELHALQMQKIQNTFNVIAQKHPELLTTEQLLKINKEANGFKGILGNLKAVFTTTERNTPEFRRLLNQGVLNENAAFNFERNFKGPLLEMFQGKANPEIVKAIKAVELEKREIAGLITDNFEGVKASLAQLTDVCDIYAPAGDKKYNWFYDKLKNVDKEALIKIIEDEIKAVAPGVEIDRSKPIVDIIGTNGLKRVLDKYKETGGPLDKTVAQRLAEFKKANLTASDLDRITSIKKEILYKEDVLGRYLQQVINKYRQSVITDQVKQEASVKLAGMFKDFNADEINKMISKKEMPGVHIGTSWVQRSAKLAEMSGTPVFNVITSPDSILGAEYTASEARRIQETLEKLLPTHNNTKTIKNMMGDPEVMSKFEGFDKERLAKEINRILATVPRDEGRPLSEAFSSISNGINNCLKNANISAHESQKIMDTLKGLCDGDLAQLTPEKLTQIMSDEKVLQGFTEISTDKVKFALKLLQPKLSGLTNPVISLTDFNVSKEAQAAITRFVSTLDIDQVLRLPKETIASTVTQASASITEAQNQRVWAILNKHAQEFRSQGELFKRVIEPQILKNISTHTTGDIIKSTVAAIIKQPVAQVVELTPEKLLAEMAAKGGVPVEELAVKADDCKAILDSIKSTVHDHFKNEKLLGKLFEKINLSPAEEKAIMETIDSTHKSGEKIKSAVAAIIKQPVAKIVELTPENFLAEMSANLRVPVEELAVNADDCKAILNSIKLPFNVHLEKNKDLGIIVEKISLSATEEKAIMDSIDTIKDIANSRNIGINLRGNSTATMSSLDKIKFSSVIEKIKEPFARFFKHANVEASTLEAVQDLFKAQGISFNELKAMNATELLESLSRYKPQLASKINADQCESLLTIFKNQADARLVSVAKADMLGRITAEYNKIKEGVEGFLSAEGLNKYKQQADVQKPIEFIKNKLTDNLLHKRWLQRIGLVGLGLVGATAAYVFFFMGKDNKYNPKIEADV